MTRSLRCPWIIITVLAALLTLLACGGDRVATRHATDEARTTPLRAQITPSAGASSGLTTYSSPRFYVELTYPASWARDTNYTESFRDLRGRQYGYVQVDALGAGGSVEQVAEGLTRIHNIPFGDEPQITSLTVDGRDARLILPDPATAPDAYTAWVVVPYLRPLGEGGPQPYGFLAIFVHKDFVRSITASAHLRH